MIAPIANPTTTGGAPPSAPVSGDLSSDFETFIKMLTTQAKYQDPLEPLDSSEYAAQLAQFSMVEQQVLSNDLLAALSGQMGTGTIGQLAGWIGMEARTTTAVPFDTVPVTVYPAPPAGAAQATLVVFSDDGREVSRRLIPVSNDPVVWAGVGADGTPVPAGLYRFEVEAMDADGSLLSSTPAETYARIVEVQSSGADSRVVFEGGSETSASAVTTLREAG